MRGAKLEEEMLFEGAGEQCEGWGEEKHVRTILVIYGLAGQGGDGET